MSIKGNDKFLNMKNSNITSDASLSNQNGNTHTQTHTHFHLPKETDLSMKLLAKESYLDYTFLSTRSSLNQQFKENKYKEYIYDLHKTLDLNLELISKLITEWNNKAERDELISLFTAFKDKYNKKNSKRTEMSQSGAKILIENQIQGEIKRKMDDNAQYYNEKIKECNENMDMKEEYVKLFEKKLYEVEIYIGKATKNLVNSPYEKYKGWKMIDFLNVNNAVMRIKSLLGKEVEKIRRNINEVKQENKGYKGNEEDEDVIKDNESNVESNNTNDKVKSYLTYYKNQIRVLQMRIKLFRNCYDNMSKTMSHLTLNIQKPNSILHKKESKVIFDDEHLNHIDKDKDIAMKMIIDNNANANKSLLNLDLTRKLNNLMDFSIVLNRKGDETKFDEFCKTGFGGVALGNVTNLNMWDISCININKNNNMNVNN